MDKSPKRPLETDFNVSSRQPMDSAIANGSDSTFERNVARELEALRKRMTQMNFAHARSTGYADVRSGRDPVIDVTSQVQDPESVMETGYLKNQSPELLGGIGYSRNGGTFADRQRTAAMAQDEGLEAAKRLLEISEGASAQTQADLLAELAREYPEMMVHDKSQMGRSPVVEIAEQYSKSMNENTLAGQRRAKRQNSTKRTNTNFI